MVMILGSEWEIQADVLPSATTYLNLTGMHSGDQATAITRLNYLDVEPGSGVCIS